MSKATRVAHVPASRVLAFAVVGALVALTLGLAAVALAPNDGFADVAAAAVTRAFLVPLGAVIGAGIGWRTGR